MYTNGLTAEAAGSAASSNLISALAYNPFGIEQPVDAQGNLTQLQPGLRLERGYFE